MSISILLALGTTCLFMHVYFISVAISISDTKANPADRYDEATRAKVFLVAGTLAMACLFVSVYCIAEVIMKANNISN